MYEISVLVFGLTAVVQRAGLPSKWLPLFATLIGGLISALPFYQSPHIELMTALFQGMLIGLTVAGVVSGVDRRIEKIK
jgi:hypothetical protein